MNCHSVFNCVGHGHELTNNRLIKETVLRYVNEAEFKELFTIAALEKIETVTSSAIAATSSAIKSSLDARNAVNDLTAQTMDFVNDAINNTAVVGGIIADTFVTATANGVGAVARTQRDVNSESVSVKDFGAKGDNVTDDTAAFKAAIAHARKTSTTIYVPAGRFLISERLFFGLLKAEDAFVQPTQSFNICTGIIGAGNDATFLVPTAALKGDVVIDLTGLRHKYLRDFTILSLDPVNCPAIGILTARFYRASIDAPTNNDWGEFQNVALHEYFSFAPYLAHATEMLVVNQCKFWTNHDDAIGAYAITANLLETAPFIKEAVETEMKFTTGNQSNIHQKHTDCDYWLGSNNPTRSDAAMVWIKGALMHKFIRPFFNNNGTNHDSVRYDRAIGEAFSYGLTIQDACYHQITNCGLRIVCPNVATTYSGNNRTTKFIEAEIIIEEYTNGLVTGWVDEDVHIHSPLHNSTIASCRSVNWKESHSIEGSHIGVRDAFVTDNTDAVASNKFTLEKGGSVSSIRGFYSAPAHNSAQEIIMGRSDGSALELASGVGFFAGDLLKVNHRVNSLSQFNYTSYYNNGRKEAAVRRGGWFEVHTPDGGFMLTAPDGTKWNIGVSNAGELTVVAKV